MNHFLELRGVCAGYGSIQALHGVNLHVPEGAVVALVGPNGAGKTTTLRTISGSLRPTSGEIRLAGRRIDREPANILARRGVIHVPEGRGVFPSLSVAENLAIFVRGLPEPGEARDEALSQFPVLGQRLQQRAGTLSGGEQQMLAMTRALVRRPRLLLLDELSMGLAPMVVQELFEHVEQIAAGGVTVLMVEQYLQWVERLADYVYVMTKGEVSLVCEGPDVRTPPVLAAIGVSA